MFVANLESYESDLTYLDQVLPDTDAADSTSDKVSIEQGIRDVLLPDRALVSYVDDPARVAEVSLSARRGVRLWDLLLFLTLAVALLEPWFANRISLRRISKPNRVLPSQSSPRGRLRVVSRGNRQFDTQSEDAPEPSEVGVT
jgi:hypothetical protein